MTDTKNNSETIEMPNDHMQSPADTDGNKINIEESSKADVRAPKRRRRLGDRKDGWRLRHTQSVFAVMPHIMKKRSDAQVFFDEIDEGLSVLSLGEQSTGVIFISATLSIINGSVFFYDLSAVHGTIGEQQQSVSLFIQDQHQLFDVIQNGAADGQKIVHLHVVELV